MILEASSSTYIGKPRTNAIFARNSNYSM